MLFLTMTKASLSGFWDALHQWMKQKLLLLLTRMLEIHFKKSAVIILDEYDVPIAKASSNGYYSQMLDVMRAMMSTTLKDNTSLDFAVITGCLKIAKESIFTGTNNFVSDTILSPRLSESFGFTQADVDQMLKDAGLESQSAEIKAWYDGYHFGDADIYCPWDVISYLRDFQYGVAQKPKSYWKTPAIMLLSVLLSTMQVTISPRSSKR